MNEYRGRKSLDLDLLEVETKINVLFRLVNSAFNDCMESFYEKDLILSKKIIEEDKNINQLSNEVELLEHINLTGFEDQHALFVVRRR